MNSKVTSPKQVIVDYLKSQIYLDMPINEFVKLISSPEVEQYIHMITAEDLGLDLRPDWREIIIRTAVEKQ